MRKPILDEPEQVIAFIRDRGVICYRTPIFAPTPITSIPELLLSSGLGWMWARRREAVQEFTALEEEPLRMVLFQVVDSQSDYVFAPHNPITPVEQLLRHWNVTKDTVRKTRPYDLLRSYKLESLYDLMESNT